MVRHAWNNYRLLWAVLGILGACSALAQQPPLLNARYTEVRTLATLPSPLAGELGWHRNAKDSIADLDQQRETDGPRLVQRWFLVGGLSAGEAVVAIEERTTRSNESFHVKRYSQINDGWKLSEEWIVAVRPHTLDEVRSLLQSGQTRFLTDQWHKRLHDQERETSIDRSSPARWHSRLPLREFDINDIEIREIEGVVHALMPGAIVNISGVAKGCPCENGAGCTAQIWLLLYTPASTSSLEVSQINDRWTIGPVQQWHLDLRGLEQQRFPNRAAYRVARQAMEERFPMCPASAALAYAGATEAARSLSSPRVNVDAARALRTRCSQPWRQSNGQ